MRRMFCTFPPFASREDSRTPWWTAVLPNSVSSELGEGDVPLRISHGQPTSERKEKGPPGAGVTMGRDRRQLQGDRPPGGPGHPVLQPPKSHPQPHSTEGFSTRQSPIQQRARVQTDTHPNPEGPQQRLAFPLQKSSQVKGPVLWPPGSGRKGCDLRGSPKDKTHPGDPQEEEMTGSTLFA